MAEEKITLLVRDAMVDCRRDQLWLRLSTNSPPLSFSEFVHLTTLVHSETLDEVQFHATTDCRPENMFTLVKAEI